LCLIEQLEEERLVRIDGGYIRRGKSTRTYYYENLSMIPDERKYEVHDIVSGKLICLLDERFMLNFAAPGALFVAKGGRIVDLDVEAEKEKINVEPGVKRESEIPKWEGEEIPVPFAVAQEVGELRNKIASFIASDSAVVKIADLETDLKREYGVRVNSSCLGTLIDIIKEQIKEQCPVPTAKEVVVEITKDKKEAVINACFGHRVNETFGRLIVALLGARLGTDISMEIDPYRIKLKSGRRVQKEALQQTLNSIEPEFVQPILEKTLKNSFLLKWELLNVAKRFGALRKDFDRKRISADTLVKLFSGTPIYEETVNDIFADKLDVERTKKVLMGLKSGEIKLCFSSCGLGLSPIGASGYLSWRDVLASERNESLIIDALRNRIMNDRVILFCVYCKRWESQRRVKTVIESGTESLVCPFATRG